MPTRPIVPPYRGISNATPYYRTPGDMCPPNGMLNARCFVPTDDRPQVGKRPGLLRQFTARVGSGGFIQGMKSITRASIVTGYDIGGCEDITTDWEGKESDALLGQVWLLRSNLAMYRNHYENTGASGTYPVADTATTNPSTQDVSCITHTPDGAKVIFGSTYAVTGRSVSRITCIRSSDATVLWSHKIDPGASRFVNTVAATNLYVFVTTGQYLRVLSVADGTQLQEHDLDQWSSEAIDARVSADGLYLYVLFFGSNAAATLTSGQLVTTGKYAQHWRSGVMKFSINDSAPYLRRVTYGAGLSSSNAYYESAHGYLRFSEVFPTGPLGPNGTYPTALATLADGTVAVTHTNRGWGPNAGITPTGTPPATVSLFDDTGAIIWRADTFSLLDATGDGGLNDILFDGSSALFSSISAIAADAQGDIYVGGRTVTTPRGSACVFKLSGSDGSMIWATNLGMNASTQTVRQAAMCIDPTDGSVWVAGDRNTSWTGASSRAAHLWKLNPDTGDILGFFDLAAASKSGLGVSVDQNGQIAYCSTKV